MQKDLYKGRADQAKRLRKASGLEKEALDFIRENFEAIAALDLPDEEKDFLSEVAEIKGGDLRDEIDEYEMAYKGLEPNDLLGFAESYHG